MQNLLECFFTEHLQANSSAFLRKLKIWFDILTKKDHSLLIFSGMKQLFQPNPNACSFLEFAIIHSLCLFPCSLRVLLQ